MISFLSISTNHLADNFTDIDRKMRKEVEEEDKFSLQRNMLICCKLTRMLNIKHYYCYYYLEKLNILLNEKKNAKINKQKMYEREASEKCDFFFLSCRCCCFC